MKFSEKGLAKKGSNTFLQNENIARDLALANKLDTSLSCLGCNQCYISKDFQVTEEQAPLQKG